MKIFVIGPIIPFTGGIAKATTSLCNYLSEKNDVTAVSFSMMYPKFLYPGEMQKRGDLLSETAFAQKFILNSLNPLSWIRVVRLVRKEKPQWLVFEWWHTYFFPAYFFISLFSKLSAKAKINVVCHNIVPHEEGLVKKLIHIPLAKAFLSTADQIVVLSKSEQAVVKKMLPKACPAFLVIPEDNFGRKIQKFSKDDARKKLGIKKKKVLLYFGTVRKYKGLEDLLVAFSKVRVKGVVLVIAGSFWEPVSKYRSLIKKLKIEGSVIIFEGYAPDEKVPLFFCAADLLVLPHRSATQSGVPHIAQVYNVPMIVTKVGGNPFFVNEGVSGFIVPPKSPSELAEAIDKSFDKNVLSKLEKGAESGKGLFAWGEEKEKKFFGGR